MAQTIVDSDPAPADRPEAGPAAQTPAGGRLARWFGPLTALRAVVLVVVFAFLGGAVGYTVAQRDTADTLSTVDVGFLQDMSFHHEQAIELSMILLGKDGIAPDLRSYAWDIIRDQRFQMGQMQATLDRFGHSTSVGSEVMGWMGPPIPRDQMPGLATPAQVRRLQAASGNEAEALWIALMSEHHLGGIHMADDAYRHGHDRRTRNIAYAAVTVERDEVVEMAGSRKRLGLPIPKGFEDPLRDPDLRPLSLSGD